MDTPKKNEPATTDEVSTWGEHLDTIYQRLPKNEHSAKARGNLEDSIFHARKSLEPDDA